MKKNKEVKDSGKAPDITKKNHKEGTTETDSKKKHKVKSKELADANVSKAGKETAKEAAERATKYIYSEDCTTATKKKEFRRKARAAISSFDKQIKKLKKSTDEKDQKQLQQVEKEYTTWRKTHLTPLESVKG